MLEFFTKILLIEKTEKKLRKCKSSYSDGYNGWLTSVDWYLGKLLDEVRRLLALLYEVLKHYYYHHYLLQVKELEDIFLLTFFS